MTLIEDIRKTVGSEWEEFEEMLSGALTSCSSLLNKVNGYLLDTSGKKLRPLLAIVASKACSGSVNVKAKTCAAVSELIHTATLLHDDVVDESDTRRGRPTVRRLFSPGVSLLIGDYWLTKAIHLLIANDCPYEVLALYSKAIEQLAEGEVLQMEMADRLTTTEEDYINIISRKTASLFIASVKGPAIVSGASPEVVDAMEKFAWYAGCAFQIRDDILDFYPTSKTGKDSGSDIMERKITMPLLCAMENSSDGGKYVRARMADISAMPGKEEEDRKIADEIRDFAVSGGGLESAGEKLSGYISRAIGCLSVLPESVSRRPLEDIASYIGML